MTNQQMQEMDWIEICDLDDVTANTGVGALIADQPIALFRVGDEARVYALSARDPVQPSQCHGTWHLGRYSG